MKNKKGLSSIIETIILVLLAIVLIGVIWAIIISLVNNSQSKTQSQNITYVITQNVCNNETIVTQPLNSSDCVVNFTWNNSVWTYDHYGYYYENNYKVLTPTICYYKNNNEEIKGFQLSFYIDENQIIPTQQVCQQQEVDSGTISYNTNKSPYLGITTIPISTFKNYPNQIEQMLNETCNQINSSAWQCGDYEIMKE